MWHVRSSEKRSLVLWIYNYLELSNACAGWRMTCNIGDEDLHSIRAFSGERIHLTVSINSPPAIIRQTRVTRKNFIFRRFEGESWRNWNEDRSRSWFDTAIPLSKSSPWSIFVINHLVCSAETWPCDVASGLNRHLEPSQYTSESFHDGKFPFGHLLKRLIIVGLPIIHSSR